MPRNEIAKNDEIRYAQYNGMQKCCAFLLVNVGEPNNFEGTSLREGLPTRLLTVASITSSDPKLQLEFRLDRRISSPQLSPGVDDTHWDPQIFRVDDVALFVSVRGFVGSFQFWKVNFDQFEKVGSTFQEFSIGMLPQKHNGLHIGHFPLCTSFHDFAPFLRSACASQSCSILYPIVVGFTELPVAVGIELMECVGPVDTVCRMSTECPRIPSPTLGSSKCFLLAYVKYRWVVELQFVSAV